MKVRFNTLQDLQDAVRKDPPTIDPSIVTKIQIGPHKYSVSVGADGGGTVKPQYDFFRKLLGSSGEAQDIQRLLFPPPVAMGAAKSFPGDFTELEPSAPPVEEPASPPPPPPQYGDYKIPTATGGPPTAPVAEPPPYDDRPLPPYEPPQTQEPPPAYGEGEGGGGGLFVRTSSGRFRPLGGGEPEDEPEGAAGGAIGGAAGGHPPARRPPGRPMPVDIPLSQNRAVTDLTGRIRGALGRAKFEFVNERLQQVEVYGEELLAGTSEGLAGNQLSLHNALKNWFERGQLGQDNTISLAVVPSTHGTEIPDAIITSGRQRSPIQRETDCFHAYVIVTNPSTGAQVIIDAAANHRAGGISTIVTSPEQILALMTQQQMRRGLLEPMARMAAITEFKVWYGPNMLPASEALPAEPSAPPAPGKPDSNPSAGPAVPESSRLTPTTPVISEETAALVTALLSQPYLFDTKTPGLFGEPISVGSALLLSGQTVDNHDNGLEVAAGLCHRLSQVPEVAAAGFTCSLAVVVTASTRDGTKSMYRLVPSHEYGSLNAKDVLHCYLLLDDDGTGEQLIIDPSASWWGIRQSLCIRTPEMLRAEMQTMLGQSNPRPYCFNGSVFGDHNRDDSLRINQAVFGGSGHQEAARRLFKAWYGANMLP